MKRLIIYLVGLFIMAFGVSASIISNLGVSPIDTIPYVTSEILKIDMGICTTAIFTCYVLLQMLLLGRRFEAEHPSDPLSRRFQGFISITNRLAAASPSGASDMESSYSIFVLQYGASGGLEFFLYVETDIMSLPAEGLPRRWLIRTKRPMSTTKIFLTGPSLQFLRSYQSAFEGIQGNSGREH